jgi:predicted ATPase/DNA-binding winged helix-turn-helix (wHTH) protein
MIDNSHVQLKACLVDTRQQLVHRAEGSSRITTKETQLFLYLVSNPGRTIPREELLVEVWGYDSSAFTRAVDNMVRKLRSKLENDTRNPIHIHTVHGEGYRFEPLSSLPATAPVPQAQEATSAPTNTNLQTSWSTFVGRTKEIATVDALLQSPGQLVTLIGPSGIGKTRIAIEIGQTLLKSHRFSGIWMVDLSEARDENQLLEALARCLHMEGREFPSINRIAQSLAARGQVLLIADNVEQLIEPFASTIATIRKISPQTSYLVTSQHLTGCPGEQLVKIGPLSSDEAYRLFHLRAEELGALDSDETFNTAAVERLVSQLEGSPLALELAASRSLVLSPEQLLERFEKHLDVLARESGDASHRHNTLRNAVSWSWQLLTGTERDILIQCSAFEGGFSVAAAEALTAALDSPEPGLHILQRLMDKSMLYSSPTSEDGQRLWLYNAVRAFAREHAEQTGRSTEIRNKHLQWVAERCLASHFRLDRESLSIEHDNILSAKRYAVEVSSPLQCAIALGINRLVGLTTSLAYGQHVLVEAYEEFPEDPLSVHLLIEIATRLHNAGEHEKAERQLQEAIAVAQQGENYWLRARSQMCLSESYFNRGETQKALDAIADAIVIAQEGGIEQLLLPMEVMQAKLTLKHGQVAEALSLFQELEERITTQVTNDNTLEVLEGYTSALILDGQIKQASKKMEELDRVIPHRGYRYTTTLAARAWCAAELGDTDTAIPLAERSLQIIREYVLVPIEAHSLNRLAQCWMAAGDPKEFLRYSEQALQIYERLKDRGRIGLTMGNIGISYRMSGDDQQATDYLERSLDLLQDTAKRISAMIGLHLLAIRAKTDRDAANTIYEQIVDSFYEGGTASSLLMNSIAKSHLELARIRQQPSDERQAAIDRLTEQISEFSTSNSYETSADIRVLVSLLSDDVNRVLSTETS